MECIRCTYLASKYQSGEPLSLLKLLSSSYAIKDGRLFCALAMQYKFFYENVLHLYERYPIKKSNLKAPEDGVILERIVNQYITKLEEKCLKPTSSRLQHGLVTLYL